MLNIVGDLQCCGQSLLGSHSNYITLLSDDSRAMRDRRMVQTLFPLGVRIFKADDVPLCTVKQSQDWFHKDTVELSSHHIYTSLDIFQPTECKVDYYSTVFSEM